MTPERLSRQIVAMGLETAQIARNIERDQQSDAARELVEERLVKDRDDYRLGRTENCFQPS